MDDDPPEDPARINVGLTVADPFGGGGTVNTPTVAVNYNPLFTLVDGGGTYQVTRGDPTGITLTVTALAGGAAAVGTVDNIGTGDPDVRAVATGGNAVQVTAGNTIAAGTAVAVRLSYNGQRVRRTVRVV